MLKLFKRTNIAFNYRAYSSVFHQSRFYAVQEEESNDFWDADEYSSKGAHVYYGASRLIDLAQLKPGERVLDLGCGSGELARFFDFLGCDVLAIDSSPSMVAAAKAKGINARLIDAHHQNFENTFDVVFSNYSLHWMSTDPRRVIRNVRKSLKKGGRFVGEFAGKGQMDSVINPLRLVLEEHGFSFRERNPWICPSDNEYKELLESEGFHVEHVSLKSREIPLAMGPIGWLELFGKNFLFDISHTKKKQIYNGILKKMHPMKLNEEGFFLGDYMDLTFLASKNE